MNKKIVIVCNSIDRLKLMDRYMFRDEFMGGIIILTDDRVYSQKNTLEKIILSMSNINLKNATVLGLEENNILEYVLSVIPGDRDTILDFW